MGDIHEGTSDGVPQHLRAKMGGGGGRVLLKGRGGVWNPNVQKNVNHKWPDKIFPFVNFAVSHDGHFGLEGGGGGLLLRCRAILILPCSSLSPLMRLGPFGVH